MNIFEHLNLQSSFTIQFAANPLSNGCKMRAGKRNYLNGKEAWPVKLEGLHCMLPISITPHVLAWWDDDSLSPAIHREKKITNDKAWDKNAIQSPLISRANSEAFPILATDHCNISALQIHPFPTKLRNFSNSQSPNPHRERDPEISKMEETQYRQLRFSPKLTPSACNLSG